MTTRIDRLAPSQGFDSLLLIDDEVLSTFSDFVRNNEGMEDEIEEIGRLRVGQEYQGGGGAWGTFVVKRIDPLEEASAYLYTKRHIDMARARRLVKSALLWLSENSRPRSRSDQTRTVERDESVFRALQLAQLAEGSPQVPRGHPLATRLGLIATRLGRYEISRLR